ncbi:hypothetical protein B0T10DRAFT_499582, partial [Thelonectria olida]
MDAPECHACQRTFTSHESLRQHLEHATVHNRRPRRQRAGRITNPRRQHAQRPRDEEGPRHSHREPQRLHSPMPWPQLSDPDDFWDFPWHVSENQIAVLAEDDIWCCLLCDREFATERALQQHMNDSSTHAILVQDRMADLIDHGWDLNAAAFRDPESPRTRPLNRGEGYQSYYHVNGWTGTDLRDYPGSDGFENPFPHSFPHSDLPSRQSTPLSATARFAEFNIDGESSSFDEALPSLPAMPARAPTPDEPEELSFDHLEGLSLEEQVKQLKGMLQEVKTELRQEKAALKREKTLRQCSMCYERPTDTVTKCGHQFCRTCVSYWQRQQAGRHQPFQTPCPMCRAPMGKPIRMYV